jgi:hypothetical protein
MRPSKRNIKPMPRRGNDEHSPFESGTAALATPPRIWLSSSRMPSKLDQSFDTMNQLAEQVLSARWQFCVPRSAKHTDFYKEGCHDLDCQFHALGAFLACEEAPVTRISEGRNHTL